MRIPVGTILQPHTRTYIIKVIFTFCRCGTGINVGLSKSVNLAGRAQYVKLCINCSCNAIGVGCFDSSDLGCSVDALSLCKCYSLFEDGEINSICLINNFLQGIVCINQVICSLLFGFKESFAATDCFADIAKIESEVVNKSLSLIYLVLQVIL